MCTDFNGVRTRKSIVTERYIVKFDYNKLPAACREDTEAIRHTHTQVVTSP